MITAIDRAEADLVIEKEEIRKAQTAVNKARAVFDHHQRRAAEIKTFLRLHERYSSVDDGAPDDATQPQKTKADLLTDAAEQYLKTLGDRASIQDLVDGLKTDGIEIGGKNENQNLSSILSRDRRFNYVLTKGWGLAGWPDSTSASDGNGSTQEEAPNEEASSGAPLFPSPG